MTAIFTFFCAFFVDYIITIPELNHILQNDPGLRQNCGALEKAIQFCKGLLLCSIRWCGCTSDGL